MKGIILAGGSGTRLHPLTLTTSKQLLPIYDKPMIYYPLSLLMLVNIKEILIITTKESINDFKKLLGDGHHLGIHLEYIIQESPKGLAEAYILGEDFLNNQKSTMILGDNLFYGDYYCFRDGVNDVRENKTAAKIFAYYVNNPSDYGVVEFDQNKKIKNIEEKPKDPKSNYAIPGLYVFDESAPERAKMVKPSLRGELEITSIIDSYVSDGIAQAQVLPRGIAWLDTGTPKNLNRASSFISMIEERQGLKVGCIEEVAYRQGFIDHSQFKSVAQDILNPTYRDYLLKLHKELGEL